MSESSASKNVSMSVVPLPMTPAPFVPIEITWPPVRRFFSPLNAFASTGCRR
jgi:hypothetical protein